MDAAEDEKKPFDAEVAAAEEALPDPDEHLMLDQGSGKAWLVKIRLAPPNVLLISLKTLRLHVALYSRVFRFPNS